MTVDAATPGSLIKVGLGLIGHDTCQKRRSLHGGETSNHAVIADAGEGNFASRPGLHASPFNNVKEVYNTKCQSGKIDRRRSCSRMEP